MPRIIFFLLLHPGRSGFNLDLPELGPPQEHRSTDEETRSTNRGPRSTNEGPVLPYKTAVFLVRDQYQPLVASKSISNSRGFASLQNGQDLYVLV